MKYILLAYFLFTAACSSDFVKKGDAYIYKDKITLTFANPPDSARLKNLAAMLALLLKDAPADLKAESFSVDGLGDDEFSNFFLLGDALLLGGVKPYQNKMMAYAFLASTYDKHLQLQKRHTPIPLGDFSRLVNAGPPCTAGKLNSYAVTYALEHIFFVSFLEMSERQSRYFYPAKTKEELFRVLFYPQLLGYWDYMAQRFGTAALFSFAKEPYGAEAFRAAFGEEPSDIETSYVKYAAKDIENLTFNPEAFRASYEELLQLYMSGTKKSLMKE